MLPVPSRNDLNQLHDFSTEVLKTRSPSYRILASRSSHHAGVSQVPLSGRWGEKTGVRVGGGMVTSRAVKLALDNIRSFVRRNRSDLE